MATWSFNGDPNAMGQPIIAFNFHHSNGTIHTAVPTAPATQFNPGDNCNHTCFDWMCIGHCQVDPRFTQTS